MKPTISGMLTTCQLSQSINQSINQYRFIEVWQPKAGTHKLLVLTTPISKKLTLFSVPIFANFQLCFCGLD